MQTRYNFTLDEKDILAAVWYLQFENGIADLDLSSLKIYAEVSDEATSVADGITPPCHQLLKVSKVYLMVEEGLSS